LTLIKRFRAKFYCNPYKLLEKVINFDANASYGPLKGLKELVWEKVESLNPSSIHSGGQKARSLIEEARDSLGELLGLTSDDRLVFTSGASEANNTAVMLPFWAFQKKLLAGGVLRPHFLTTSIEHPSVLEPLERLESFGYPVTRLKMQNGAFSGEYFLNNLRPETALVSVMFANNETGQILPVPEISAAIKSKRPDVLIHTDAVQLIGKAEISFSETGVDMLTLSGHKIGSFTGVGALVVKRALKNTPLLKGGPQESRWRAGTENVPGIVSLGIAARELKGLELERAAKMKSFRDDLLARLLAGLKNITVNAELQPRLPNTLSVRVPDVHADDLVVALDLKGVFVSSGAACSSGKPEPSHVLLASGLSEKEARETIRISLRAEHTDQEIKEAAETIVACILKMRAG